MGALNEQLVDGLIGYAVELDRAAEGLTADVLKAFHQLDTALASAIRDSGVDDVQRTYYRQQRGEKIISQTARAIDNGVRDARAIADADLMQFAQEAYAGLMTELESLFTVKVKFTKLTNATLRGIVKDAMVQGATQQQWWDKLAMDAKRSFSMGVRQGTLDRQAGESLVNRAVGKRIAKVQDSEGDTYFKHFGGMMDRIKTDAETILKTLASTIAEDVRQAVVQANIRFFNGLQAIATLDSRTSQLCRGRDHMAWDGDGNPIESTGATFMFPGDPPWHFRALAAGTLILTIKGYQPIETVVVGDLVWTHKNRWRPVYATMGKFEEGLIRCLNFAGGKLLVTDEHPLLCGSTWRRADKFKVGDKMVQYAQQASQVVIKVLPDCVAHNRPAGFDEKFIPQFYATTVGFGFIAGVNFQTNTAGKYEVEDVSTEGNLKSIPRSNVSHNNQFPEVGISGKPLRSQDHVFNHRAFRFHRIGSSHNLRSFCKMFGSGIRQLFIPMIDAAKRALGLHTLHCFAGGVKTRSDFDSVSLALPTKACVSKSQVLLYASQRLPFNPMPILNQSPQFFGWQHTSILSIEQLEYKGLVYNLAVAEDETYIAEGIITHNCRTFLAPILKNYNQLKRIIPNLPSSYADLLDGQAARKQTYAQWFDKQSQTRQRAILGAGKYDLYKSGKLTLQQMLDNKGNPLRVSQLRYRAARLAKGKK